MSIYPLFKKHGSFQQGIRCSIRKMTSRKNPIPFLKRHFSNHRLLLMIILFIGIMKVGLLFSDGSMYKTDEGLYWNAIAAGTSLRWLDGDVYLSNLFDRYWHRPSYVAFYSFPALAQSLLHTHNLNELNWLHFHKSFFHLTPQLTNICVSILMLLGLYLLFRRLGESKKFSIVCILGYSALFNANAYLRHLFPYDLALAFHIWSLVLALPPLHSHRPSVRACLFSGVLAGLGFSSYQGYYLLVPVAALLLLFPFKRFPRREAIFSFSFFSVIAFWEILSRFYATSFISQCLWLSRTVNLGDYKEGFIFMPEYLLVAEPLAGIVLLSGFAIGLCHGFKGTNLRGRVLLTSLLLAYMYYGVQVFFLKNTVFYARLLHMYFPFLVYAAFLSLKLLKSRLIKQRVMLCIIAVLFIHFISWYVPYFRQEYPKVILERHNAYDDSRNSVHLADYLLKRHVPDSANMVTVNVLEFDLRNAEVSPVEHCYPVNENRFVLEEKSLHPCNIVAYQYEGRSAKERKVLQRREYYMKIYIARNKQIFLPAKDSNAAFAESNKR